MGNKRYSQAEYDVIRSMKDKPVQDIVSAIQSKLGIARTAKTVSFHLKKMKEEVPTAAVA